MHISMRWLHALIVTLFALALAACGLAKPLPNFDSFAHRVSDSTVALYWNCSRPEPGLVRMEGVVNNPYYPQPITDLGFTLYGVSAQGGDISTAHANAQAYEIFTNDPTSFTINLHTVGGEVRYDLVYHYLFQGGHGGGSGIGQQQQNMARNVCAGLAP